MHFRRMDEGTDADFALLASVHEENLKALPDLLLGMLADLTADSTYPVNRMEHSIQCATRALARRQGRGVHRVLSPARCG